MYKDISGYQNKEAFPQKNTSLSATISGVIIITRPERRLFMAMVGKLAGNGKGQSRRLTITVEEMAEELGVSYPQACKLFNRIKKAYGLTDDRLPKRGCLFRKYYMEYYGINEEDYYEA